MYLFEKRKGGKEIEIGYWRKANAIHNWFVVNVMNGVNENCKNQKVTKEQFQALLKVVEDVLESRELATEVLPTASGFFYGETNYDERYLIDLEDTKRMMKKILSEWNDKLEYFYYPSW